MRLILILLLLGCEAKNKLEVGHCLARADEAHIWKINEIDENTLTLEGQTLGIKNKIFEADLQDHWLKVPCHTIAH